MENPKTTKRFVTVITFLVSKINTPLIAWIFDQGSIDRNSFDQF